MKRILVPTDFSINAKSAAFVALKIAADINCEVEFLNSYSVLNSGFQTEISNQINAQEALENAKENMDAFIQSILDSGVEILVPYSINLSDKPLIPLIQEYGMNKNLSLIVMGTNGASGLNYILGSNSLSVAKKINTPLLIVPIHNSFEGVKKVTYFSDFQKADKAALSKLEEVFSHQSLSLNIIHLNDNGLLSVSENTLRMENFVFEIKEELNSTNINGKVYDFEANVDSVNRVIAQENPDIISLSLIERSFWDNLTNKSLAKSIILHPTKPIFVYNTY